MQEGKNLAALAALPTPMPPVAEHQVFTPEQWSTLLSMCEVFLPAFGRGVIGEQTLDRVREMLLSTTPTEQHDLVNNYLDETVASNAEFKESVRQRFAMYIPKAQVNGVCFLLSALNTRLGSLAMTGSITLIHSQPLPTRTKIVLSWWNSSIGPLRSLYQACEFITKATWLAQSTNLHHILGYPKIPKDIERHPSYDFQFLDFSNQPANASIDIEADILIIGSGCGAGVVAEHLSSNLSNIHPKPRILLLEKSYHFPSSHFPMDQAAAGVNIQEGGGGILSDDGSIAVVAGSTWGGGGTINWSASLQPQHFVREEWTSKHNLPFATSQEFQDCLDEVCDNMGVCRTNDLEGLNKIEHNFGNRTLLESARRLGLKGEVVPQNTAGRRHYCGRCNFGCASATKQGPTNLWLPAAAKNGVEFIEGCFAEKIIWDETVPGTTRQAIGVKAVWTPRSREESRRLNIKAGRIIVSCGTLHSPLLLHRSGLTPEVNKHIGSNLHLHPVLTTRGTYPERVDPWDGAILTSVMTSLENFDGQGHGPKIEVILGTPDMSGTMLPYRPQLSLDAVTRATDDEAAYATALDYRLRVAKQGYSFGLISIQRDHADESNGKKSYVYSDADDPKKIKISYTPSVKDRECLLEGAITAARMHFVMGAEEIEVCSPNVPMFVRPSTCDKASVSVLPADSASKEMDTEAFDQWLADIKAKGMSLLETRTTRLGSAHQMGTCRMSASPADGVVDTCGKVWATNNVFVADASILPSASGVNPMITAMGLSLRVARGIVKEISER